MTIVHKAVIAAVCFIQIGRLWAYEVPTHAKLAEKSFEMSALKSGIWVRLGLHTVEENPLFPNSAPIAFVDKDDGPFLNESLSIQRLLEFGARYEDVWTDTQFFAHFFEPQVSQAGLLGVGYPSPDWALEDQVTYPYRQPYSYARAKTYLYAALTSRAKHDRDEMWGKTFQTLGHVMHHVHDMTAPETGRPGKGLVVVTHWDTTEIQRWLMGSRSRASRARG